MSDVDKTIVIEAGEQVPDYGKCQVCGAALMPDQEQSGLLRCPVCRFTQKPKVVIAPGNIIDNKYRVLSHLNSGGCGDIFFCHPLNDLSVRYVLKVLRAAGDSNFKRFKREAEILISVRNEERIARIIDFGEAGDNAYIIMEYINGKNLKQLKEEFRFDEQAVLQTAREVVVALKHIWDDYAVIHRDIKPENIMLDEEFCLKILDFGLSKQCCDEEEDTNITMAMSGLGTPGYMSPEQFSDAKNADFRSDIFSLGATMCFLLTGKKPFSGSTPMEIYHDTLVNSPPLSLQFDTECSAGCLQLIRKMMQREPDDRHCSYSELLDEIEGLIQ
ncbi:MAG: serine/threonine protein kinase [Lentisphaeria bacterium]|nr:serine/threonine protein kinase [Lentisphaeria bacterium]